MLTHVAVQWVVGKSWVHIAAYRIAASAQSVPFSHFSSSKNWDSPNRNHFLPQPSDSFSNRPTIRRGVIWSADSIFEENMNKYISLYCLMFFLLLYLISICINGQTAFPSSLLVWKTSLLSFRRVRRIAKSDY